MNSPELKTDYLELHIILFLLAYILLPCLCFLLSIVSPVINQHIGARQTADLKYAHVIFFHAIPWIVEQKMRPAETT